VEAEAEAEEEALRQFDMDTSYGPCIGVTRLRRWDRAAAMGLSPPQHVRDLILLRRHHHGGSSSSFKISNDSSSKLLDDGCLWAGKV
jgi:DNA polymerase delta subunit 4